MGCGLGFRIGLGGIWWLGGQGLHLGLRFDLVGVENAQPQNIPAESGRLAGYESRVLPES